MYSKLILKELRELHNDYPLVPNNSTQLNTQKRIEAEKNDDKDGKALYKLMNNAVYGNQWKNKEIESM